MYEISHVACFNYLNTILNLYTFSNHSPYYNVAYMILKQSVKTILNSNLEIKIFFVKKTFR